MCCFSQPVELVADTNIFVRSDNGQQFLVYSMSYAAASDLAMVLPLPVPPSPSEDAVRFISLQRYPTFFDDMRRGFPRMETTGALGAKPVSLDAPKLRVHDVGDFEASFVPRIADFNRLEDRFRIPPDVWERLPAYHDYGFAVFKLKASGSQWLTGALGQLFGGGNRKPRRVHPMAFTFPRRNPELLYFPTVHIHDREVHPDAMFDHMLYCQPDAGMDNYLQGWEPSDRPASAFMAIARTEGIVNPDQHCWRHSLKGRLQNHDGWLGNTGYIPSNSNLNLAEAVLAEGGSLEVVIDTRHQHVHSLAEIPRQRFQIVGVDLSGHVKTTRAFCDDFFGRPYPASAWDNLATLRLSRSTVSDWGVHELLKLKGLRCLWLDHTKITDRVVEFLVKMNLRELHLEGTTLSQNAVETIRKALPHCRIAQ
jgi:hypothetical protein